MSRWKAAGIHLSINAVIALLAAGLIYGIWYPHPYSQAAGAGTLVLLLLGVDLVLGPMLTLVVFKAGKKGLKFDLAAIAILQVCAFVYGLHVVAAARPAFIVGVIDRFVLVSANELDQADLDKATDPEFRTAPWTGPELVGTRMPADIKQRNDLIFSALAGKDIDHFPQYYVPYADVVPTLKGNASSLDALKRKHPEISALLDRWVHEHSTRKVSALVALPLKTRERFFTVLLDGEGDGTVLDVLPIDPW